MKQKLQDLLLLLKEDKKTQVIAALAFVAVFYLVLADGGQRKTRPQKVVENNSLTQSRDEAARDVVSAVTEQLNKLEVQQTEVATKVKELQTTADDDRQRMSEILKKMLDKLAQNPGGGQMPGQMMAPGVEQVSIGPDGEPQMDGGSMMASFGDTSSNEIAPPPPPPDRKKVVIMPGDTLRVRLLSGVHAPTDGTPYPVVVEAVSDVQGPDGSSLPIGKARFVVAAQGSLSDSRALFRLTTMNIRLPNGEKQEVPVDGWLVGEDGIRGLQGVLLDPIGKAIGAAMEAGVLEGIGEGLAASQTDTNSFYGNSTTTVSGDPLIYAGGKGISEGAEEFRKMITERAALLVPHVEVYSGREATAVFSKTVTIEGLYEALDDDGVGFGASLD